MTEQEKTADPKPQRRIRWRLAILAAITLPLIGWHAGAAAPASQAAGLGGEEAEEAVQVSRSSEAIASLAIRFDAEAAACG
jgi:hypothetical protein